MVNIEKLIRELEQEAGIKAEQEMMSVPVVHIDALIGYIRALEEEVGEHAN